MPRIFDNIDQQLLPALRDTLTVSRRADFCVGYFNLRGWKSIADLIEGWSGTGGDACRLLVGMQKAADEELRDALSMGDGHEGLDVQTAIRLRRQLAQQFREQLTYGRQTNDDERALQQLARQLGEGKVVVKLFLRHGLHAKLYLFHRDDKVNPFVGFLGSSNLTFHGLEKQGELNVDVLDHDACAKLAAWFEARWNDRWCVDISADLTKVIEESWARTDLIPPYHIYLKLAYHLSHEVREGLAGFSVPWDIDHLLFDYQKAAVKIAAHHLHKRGGVLLGDVVGLGKTMMATAIARIFDEDFGLDALIICPKNLVPMWEDYRERFRLRARVLSLTRVRQELPNLRRYRLVVIDESHNLRNREGSRFRVIQDYVRKNESKCVLLSATPYNKTYLDLSSQLRLFLAEEKDLGIRPEALLRSMGGEAEFARRHQNPVRSLAAFERSEHADDWRDLMRLYMIRRTRSFIQQNYALVDGESGRRYLPLADGGRTYFPRRVPKTVKFGIDERDAQDPYGRLYSDGVVDIINRLRLPRYGLGNYETSSPHEPPTQNEARILGDLSRAGKRLMGFCRNNLFKRLESSGHAFLHSVDRHILRNDVFLYAIENGRDLPIGPQDVELLDTRRNDEDVDDPNLMLTLDDDRQEVTATAAGHLGATREESRRRAAALYEVYASQYRTRFRWLRPTLFVDALRNDLASDADELWKVLETGGHWNPAADRKLQALRELLRRERGKVLVFTQFADTVNYLATELRGCGVDRLEGVTGRSDDPTHLAWRFSPDSNDKQSVVGADDELRVLIATDVLSEGQNLQDCATVVNFDLPWAVIRLVQRAGRVDRIGQKAERILCYSFLPADGVERILRLRSRVRQRLRENAEVVGTDEAFFEDDDDRPIVDLYNEQEHVLEADDDGEVDLASRAFQIWKNATDGDPTLARRVIDLPPVVFSARAHDESTQKPAGVIVYARTADGTDALTWVDTNGQPVTQSPLTILQAAECGPATPALSRAAGHHALVDTALRHIADETRGSAAGGQLGPRTGARRRVYERLRQYAAQYDGTMFVTKELLRAIDELYRVPLRPAAAERLNRQMRSGVSDAVLVELVLALHQDDQLTVSQENRSDEPPQIICSLGLRGDAS